MVEEVKCTCNQCKKVWHYLERDEKSLKLQAASNAMIGCSMCCNPFGALFSNKSIDLTRELSKFKKCPDCGSADIKKEKIHYETQN